MYESKDKKEIDILWTRLTSLERAYDESKALISELQETTKSAPISQQEAKTAANSATRYRTIVKKHKEKIQDDADSIQQLLNDLEISLQNAKSNTDVIEKLARECVDFRNSATEGNSKVANLYEEITTSVESLQSIITQNEDLETELDKTREMISESEIDHSKIKHLLKDTVAVNKNVNALYDEIYGYDVVDESDESDELDEDEPSHVEGLKGKLEKSYLGLDERLQQSTEHLNSLTENTEVKYKDVINTINDNYEQFIKKCGESYDKTSSRIKKLLPDALTAGLASAYDIKKKEEENTLSSAIQSFRWAIGGLIAISLIPFVIDAYLIIKLEKELLQVIADTPKLLISILPLYFPVLWMAYSSSKKANLSKRLIEEYTHKGVLSKTFEGLSTAIADIDQDELSSELKVKLLYNLLEVNSENPGKLISNYNSTDHPLMDALDKSAKLADAVEKLSNIPGFSKLATNLERKSKKILDAADKRVSAVLDDSDEVEKSEGETIPKE